MLRIQNKKNTDIPAFSAFVVERFEERATALYKKILQFLLKNFIRLEKKCFYEKYTINNLKI